MKKLVRTMATCSIVALGALAVPTLASAEPAQAEHVGTTAQAVHGSGARMFHRALDQVQLRPEQKDAIDKLKADAAERRAPVKQARRALMLKIADQLESESGSIDRCALGSQVQAVASAVAQTRPADRKAFEQLHQILDPDQRVEFVDALRREVQAARKAHQPGPVVDQMARKLNLSADQKESLKHVLSGLKEIREAQPSFEQRRDTFDRMLQAFKTDNFDLDQVAPMGDVQAEVTNRIEARLRAAEVILPILNRQQCSTIARALRDKAQHGMSGQHHGATSSFESGED